MIALFIVFYFAHYFSLIKLNEACTLMVIVQRRSLFKFDQEVTKCPKVM